MNYIICRNKIPDSVWKPNEKEILGDEFVKYFFPENGLQPDKQVEEARKIAYAYAETGKPYILLTVSPFILKGVDVYSDLLETQQDLQYVSADGNMADFQTVMKPFAEAFCKLTYGEHYNSKPEED